MKMTYILILTIFTLFLTSCQETKDLNKVNNITTSAPKLPISETPTSTQENAVNSEESTLNKSTNTITPVPKLSISKNDTSIQKSVIDTEKSTLKNKNTQQAMKSNINTAKTTIIKNDLPPISSNLNIKRTQVTMEYTNGAEINLLSSSQLNNSTHTYLTTQSSTPLAIQNTMVPDYESLIYVNNSILTNDTSLLDIIIRISELNGVENSEGNISFSIAKNINMQLSFDPQETIRQNTTVNNSKWIMSETLTSYIFTYNVNEGIFLGQSLSKVGLTATFHSPHRTKGYFDLAVDMRQTTNDENDENDHNSNRIIYTNMTDTLAPIISLNGESNITLALGDTYIELGASALDHWEDTHITVDINGTVDTSTLGVYTITYTAKDSANNISTTKRLVTIVEHIFNYAPTAIDDQIIEIAGNDFIIPVLKNDLNNTSTIDTSSITITSNPTHGLLDINSTTGNISYIPNTNYYGKDIFTYTVQNLEGNVSNEANVSIYIAAADGSTDADDDNLSDILEIRFGSNPLESGSDIGISEEQKALLHKLHRLTWGVNAEILSDVDAKGGFDAWLTNQLTTEYIPALNDFNEVDYPAQYKRDNFHMLNYVSVEVPATIRPLHSKRYLQSVMESFWDNHFNTELAELDTGATSANELYEADAFYENAFGNFETLLTLSAQSPMMSIYLNGFQNTKEGPNENYAREIMELHTVGLDNYSNQDIVELSKIFTGWSYGYDYNNRILSRYTKSQDDPWKLDETIFEFKFIPENHDDGSDKTFLGQIISTRSGNDGVQEGLEALHILATHPKTAEFICKKLAQKFISDTPSDITIEDCKATFLHNTQADDQIKKVLITLFTSDEFNNVTTHLNKSKDDQEYLLSFARGLSINATRYEGDAPNSLGYSNLGWALGETRLSQPFYRKAEPTGYYETSDNWIISNNLQRRIVESNRLIARLEDQHLVNYFMTHNMTTGTDIIRYLISIYMDGYYTNDELKLLYETLYINNQEFNINDTSAENKLHDLFHILAFMPKTHLQ